MKLNLNPVDSIQPAPLKKNPALVCVLMFEAEYLSTTHAYLIYSAAAAAALDDISIFIAA